MCRQGGKDVFEAFECEQQQQQREEEQQQGLQHAVWQWMHQLTDEELERLPEDIWQHHVHSVDASSQCCSILVQRVRAPPPIVWSLIRRFEMPQLYKNFIRSCTFKGEVVGVGATREVILVSGLPATSSTERLEILDDEHHVLSFRVLGGDHRLKNYRSVTSLHAFDVDGIGSPGTLVVESYVVDIPQGNTKEDTCLFTDTVVRCNLQSLSHMAEKLASSTKSAPPNLPPASSPNSPAATAAAPQAQAAVAAAASSQAVLPAESGAAATATAGD